MYTYVHIYLYLHIYTDIYINIYIHVYIHIYGAQIYIQYSPSNIYMYIYVFTEHKYYLKTTMVFRGGEHYKRVKRANKVYIALVLKTHPILLDGPSLHVLEV